jgi:diguanylate cyclase (GGDEF)-like protein
MTLYRQLVIVIVTLFLLMFVGTLWLNFQSTRTFLTAQLESHAQDTATSLGLSLSTHMQHRDLALMTSMVDAVFDRGYYQAIRIEDNEGHPLVSRSAPVVHLNVPDASALVMSGWHQVGTVHVWSHPGYAYGELWRTTVETGVWFGSVALVLLVMGGVALRVLLRPLRAVERQAEQLAQRHYETQHKLPRTRELRRVVQAMNRLTGKIRSLFEEDARTARRLQTLSYEDPLTGLANRRLFMDELHIRLAPDAEHGRGGLLLIQLQDLKGINDTQGLPAGDALLRELAGILSERTGEADYATLARLGGGDFGLLMTGASPEELDQLAADICTEAMGLVPSGKGINIGVAAYAPGQTADAVLAAADAALRESETIGPNTWQRAGEALEGMVGHREWGERLRRVLQNRELVLHAQPVIAKEGGILHQEVLVRYRDQTDSLWPAGVFMPLAEELGLAREFDRLIVELALQQAAQAAGGPALAINLSAGSVQDSAFVEWLFSELARLPPASTRPVFEFSEQLAIAHLTPLRALVSRLRGAGFGYGFDHFGRGLADFGYLRSLRPDYVKIDAAFVRELVRDSDRQFFVGTLISVAHSLDILAIAEAVETDTQREVLEQLHIDALQGYLMGRPKPLNQPAPKE